MDFFLEKFVYVVKMYSPILVAVRSKPQIWNRSIVGIASSNPTEGMHVHLMSLLCW